MPPAVARMSEEAWFSATVAPIAVPPSAWIRVLLSSAASTFRLPSVVLLPVWFWLIAIPLFSPASAVTVCASRFTAALASHVSFPEDFCFLPAVLVMVSVWFEDALTSRLPAFTPG